MLRFASRYSRATPIIFLAFFACLFAPVELFSQTAQQPAKAPPAKGANPSVNEQWKSDKIEPLVDRLEAESREIYRERARLAALVAPRPGSVIADIGAGSGFMVEEFAKLVGPKGKVYAVDINAKMMERVAERAKSLGLTNIATVVTREDSVDLPPASVDMVFICDTYHHFEFPDKSLRGIYDALRPGGELIIVDFHRLPGKTPDAMLEHVRAGKEEFTKEIVNAGFTFATEHSAGFLTDNYVLRFWKKPNDAPSAGSNGIGYAGCEYCPRPTTPEAAMEDPDYKGGTILLGAFISAEGKAMEMTHLNRLGWGLDEAAVEAVKKWRFRPSTNREGKAVSAWNVIEITFRKH